MSKSPRQRPGASLCAPNRNTSLVQGRVPDSCLGNLTPHPGAISKRRPPPRSERCRAGQVTQHTGFACEAAGSLSCWIVPNSADSRFGGQIRGGVPAHVPSRSDVSTATGIDHDARKLRELACNIGKSFVDAGHVGIGRLARERISIPKRDRVREDRVQRL